MGKAGEAHRRFRQGPFAHQVDVAAGFRRALQQAGRALEHFHALEAGQVRRAVAVGAAGGAPGLVAVNADGVGFEPADQVVGGAGAVALHRDPGGVFQGIFQRGHVAVFDLLAGDHIDGLRDVAHRFHGSADAHLGGGVGAGVFRAQTQPPGFHLDRVEPVVIGGFDYVVARTLLAGDLAGAVEQTAEPLFHGKASLEAPGAPLAQPGGIERERHPGLVGEPVEHLAQRSG